MQSSAFRTDSPSRIPRMRGVSNSSARKYSQSQERDRTPSLEGRPNLSNASGGALPVPLARGVPPERGLLSAHAIGEAAPPRAPLQKRPPGGLGFPAGAARPVTPSRASNPPWNARNGGHRDYTDPQSDCQPWLRDGAARTPHFNHTGQHPSTGGAISASGAHPGKAAVRISQLPRTPRSRRRAHGAGGNHSTLLLATASNPFADAAPAGYGESSRYSPPSPEFLGETPIANPPGTPNRTPTSPVPESPHSIPLIDHTNPKGAGAGGRSEPRIRLVSEEAGLEIIPHPVTASCAAVSQPHSAGSDTDQERRHYSGGHATGSSLSNEADTEGPTTPTRIRRKPRLRIGGGGNRNSNCPTTPSSTYSTEESAKAPGGVVWLSRGTPSKMGNFSSDGGSFAAAEAGGTTARHPSGHEHKKRSKAFKALGSIFARFKIHR